MNLYQQALKVAIKAHEGQKRKHDNSAYVAHPIMVARLVEKAGFSEMPVAAALLHDVLEDTEVTEEELRAAFPPQVVDIVFAVSEVKELPWEARKEDYVRRVISGGELVWAVSVADKIHNANDLIAFHASKGPYAWSVFNRGKDKKIWFEEMLYTELAKVWQHDLLDQYAQMIKALKALSD